MKSTVLTISDPFKWVQMSWHVHRLLQKKILKDYKLPFVAWIHLHSKAATELKDETTLPFHSPWQRFSFVDLSVDSLWLSWSHQCYTCHHSHEPCTKLKQEIIESIMFVYFRQLRDICYRLACERRRIPGGEKRQPEICLCLQASSRYVSQNTLSNSWNSAVKWIWCFKGIHFVVFFPLIERCSYLKFLWKMWKSCAV